MSKLIKNYLGILAVLPFLLAPATASAFELSGFAAGIVISGHAVQVKGQEKDPEGTLGSAITDNIALETASIFGKISWQAK